MGSRFGRVLLVAAALVLVLGGGVAAALLASSDDGGKDSVQLGEDADPGGAPEASTEGEPPAGSTAPGDAASGDASADASSGDATSGDSSSGDAASGGTVSGDESADSASGAPRKTHFPTERGQSAQDDPPERVLTVPPAREFTGDGDAQLGTVDVREPVVVKWTTRGRFELRFGRESFPIIAPSPSGQLVVPAFRFELVRVIAKGRWRISITPQG